MRPTLVTVISPSSWEPALVAFARSSALIRIPRRCTSASEVEQYAYSGDVVVVGGETPWVIPPLIRRWRGGGRIVVGIASDEPARRILLAGGCDAVLPSSTPPAQLVSSVLSLRRPTSGGFPPLVAVTGARGAPGTTEVSLALAWSLSAILVDLDPQAPSLGLRLGLPPSDRPRRARVGPIEVLTLPPGLGSLSDSLSIRLVETCRATQTTVADCGLTVPRSLTPEFVVVVTDGTPMSLLRTGRALATWTGPPPLIVLNRVDNADREVSVRNVRAATGLEPAAVIQRAPKTTGPEPIPQMVTELADLTRTILQGQNALAHLADL